MTAPAHRVSVSTADAAHLAGVSLLNFPTWAARRGLAPVLYQRLGRSRVAWWDPDEVDDAAQRGPVFRAPRRA